MFKKILIALVTFLLICNASFVFSDSKKIDIHFFGTKTCFSCNDAEAFIRQTIKHIGKNNNIKINFYYHSIMNTHEKQLQLEYAKAYKVEERISRIVPAVYISSYSLIGKDEINNKLETTLTSIIKEPKESPYINEISENIESSTTQASENQIRSFTPLAVFLAGLIDGVNPCSIAMLLFFFSLLIMAKETSKAILLIGAAFITGIFSAYLGIGLGLFKFMDFLGKSKGLIVGAYSVTFIMTFGLSIVYITDYYKVRNNRYNQIKSQLPKSIKHKIHNYIRKKAAQKVFFITAFATGFAISFLEFFCTGQIYLPTITFVISTGSTSALAIIYLILYNLAFIIPLIIICIAIVCGKKVIEISSLLVLHMRQIKLAGALFFVTMAVYTGAKIIILLK